MCSDRVMYYIDVGTFVCVHVCVYATRLRYECHYRGLCPSPCATVNWLTAETAVAHSTLHVRLGRRLSSSSLFRRAASYFRYANLLNTSAWSTSRHDRPHIVLVQLSPLRSVPSSGESTALMQQLSQWPVRSALVGHRHIPLLPGRASHGATLPIHR